MRNVEVFHPKPQIPQAETKRGKFSLSTGSDHNSTWCFYSQVVRWSEVAAHEHGHTSYLCSQEAAIREIAFSTGRVLISSLADKLCHGLRHQRHFKGRRKTPLWAITEQQHCSRKNTYSLAQSQTLYIIARMLQGCGYSLFSAIPPSLGFFSLWLQAIFVPLQECWLLTM